MKRRIAVIVLVLAIASMLSAAGLRPIVPIQGTLHWMRSNTCGVSDYIAPQVMRNVYLTGNFVPTNGLLEGCAIQALGTPYMVEGCNYFAVARYTISCDQNGSVGHR